MSELERSFLASLLLGHPDILLFAGGGRARTGILAKICAQLLSYGTLMEVMNGLRDAGYLKLALVGLEASAAKQ